MTFMHPAILCNHFQFTCEINAPFGTSEPLLECTYYEAWYRFLWWGRILPFFVPFIEGCTTMFFNQSQNACCCCIGCFKVPFSVIRLGGDGGLWRGFWRGAWEAREASKTWMGGEEGSTKMLPIRILVLVFFHF